MIGYIRTILGNYVPLDGVDGIGSLNVEYIVSAIILILCIWLVFKLLLMLAMGLFRGK